MIIYKIDVLKALKEKGYNTNYLRQNKILSQKTIQYFRDDKYVSLQTIDLLCKLLDCTIQDIIEYVPNQNQNTK